MFHNEITNILNNLGRLKILFESQIKTKNLGNLKLEKEIYENVSADLNAIESSKLKIKEYFNDINKLTYKKKYVKSGQIISKLIKNVLFRVEINGIENIPKRGPCILAPHHYDAMFDGVLLSAVINRDLFFLATVEGFVAVPLYGKFLINIGCIPLKRDDSKFNARLPNAISQEKIDSFPVSNIASIKKMLIHLRNGDVLVIFPEGEAKTNGPTYERPNNEDFLPPQEGFVSIAFLAKRAYNKDVPIIPIGIKYGKGIFRTAIINIGAPIYLSNDLQNMNKQELNKAIAEYMAQIFAQIKRLST
jgi:1-acyl-sn-glycerol-3-phosphate acyltransferase